MTNYPQSNLFSLPREGWGGAAVRSIGLFGGSFNPIHNGHIALARQLLRLAGLDEVWLMVSPQNPLKCADGLVDDDIRLEMAREALKDEPHIVASDYEFHLPRPSYTWHTLQSLRHDYPQTDFTLLIGADNWACFNNWFAHEEIIAHHHIVIYPRSGSPLTAAALPPNVTLAHTDLINISSTDIRRRIRLDQPISHLVPPIVEKIIKEKGLYR